MRGVDLLLSSSSESPKKSLKVGFFFTGEIFSTSDLICSSVNSAFLTSGAATSDSLSGERFFLLSERLEDDDARRFRDLERELFERRFSFEYFLRLVGDLLRYERPDFDLYAEREFRSLDFDRDLLRCERLVCLRLLLFSRLLEREWLLDRCRLYDDFRSDVFL